MPITSITHPELPPRRRCKRAFLNPDTDLFDPELVELLSLHGDLQRHPIAPYEGAWYAQPATIVEADRIISSVVARLERLRTADLTEKHRRSSKPGGGHHGG